MAALHQHAGAADRERLLDLLEDDRLRQQVALAAVAGAAVEGAEVAVGDADVRVVEVAVDDERDPVGVGLAARAARRRPARPRRGRASSSSATRLVVGDPLAVERLREDLAATGAARRPVAHASTACAPDEAQLGHVLELADVAGHLEERVEPGALARPEASSGASRSSGRGSRPDSRSARSPRARAPRGSARASRTDATSACSSSASAVGDRLAAPPRRRTPSAGRSARATAGRGRSAASGPRTRSAAPRRRSAASRRPPRSSGTCSASRQQHLRQHDRGRALGRDRDRADLLERHPRDELDRVDRALGGDAQPRQEPQRRRRGARTRSTRSARGRARPSSSSRFSSVGTPWTSSTSASSRWKTGAMFDVRDRGPSRQHHVAPPQLVVERVALDGNRGPPRGRSGRARRSSARSRSSRAGGVEDLLAHDRALDVVGAEVERDLGERHRPS